MGSDAPSTPVPGAGSGAGAGSDLGSPPCTPRATLAFGGPGRDYGFGSSWNSTDINRGVFPVVTRHLRSPSLDVSAQSGTPALQDIREATGLDLSFALTGPLAVPVAKIRHDAPMDTGTCPIPPDLRLDRFGFIISEEPTRAAKRKLKKQLLLESSRLDKWRLMLEEWHEYTTKRAKKVKERVRKGIPHAIRAHVWQVLSGAHQLIPKNTGVYEELLKLPATEHEMTIKRDLHRTYPEHYMFHETGGPGQTALFNVLKAYAHYNPDLGYCQGMAFVAATLLSFMPEASAFWTMTCLMTTYGMSDLCRPGLPRFQLLTYQFDLLLKKYFPKLKKHLENENIASSMYSSQWFMTLYSYAFPFELVVRIWDIFLCEGWKILLRVALAVMKLGKKQLMKASVDKLLPFLQNFTSHVDIDKVIKTALKIRITTGQLEKMEHDFNEAQRVAEETLAAVEEAMLHSAVISGAARNPERSHNSRFADSSDEEEDERTDDEDDDEVDVGDMSPVLEASDLPCPSGDAPPKAPSPPSPTFSSVTTGSRDATTSTTAPASATVLAT